LEVVAPAGEFGAVVAETPDLREELLAGEVGPLAGEEGDWAWHLGLLADGQDTGWAGAARRGRGEKKSPGGRAGAFAGVRGWLDRGGVGRGRSADDEQLAVGRQRPEVGRDVVLELVGRGAEFFHRGVD